MSHYATFFLFSTFSRYNTHMNIETISLQIIRVSETQYPNFCSRLKYAMTLRDCSVQKLAGKIFLTHSTISGYRNGTRMPSCDILRNIAKELHVSTDFLLCATNYICVSETSILPPI